VTGDGAPLTPRPVAVNERDRVVFAPIMDSFGGSTLKRLLEVAASAPKRPAAHAPAVRFLR